MQELINSLIKIFPIELVVILVSILPVVELRGGIPIGIALGLSPLKSTLLCILGSIVPAPFILFTIRPLFTRLRRTKLFRKIVDRITDDSINKSEFIRKYGFWGLLIFVAIPLPGTGVWSGSLAAALLNMRIKIAFPAIVIGNIIAGFLILALSYGVISII